MIVLHVVMMLHTMMELHTSCKRAAAHDATTAAAHDASPLLHRDSSAAMPSLGMLPSCLLLLLLLMTNGHTGCSAGWHVTDEASTGASLECRDRERKGCGVCREE